jgi:tetratricopeptide (TPR) repeat protein
MRFCPHCGAPLLAGAKFCVQCGQRLTARGKPANAADNSKTGIDLGFLSVFAGLVIAGALIAWVLVVREQRFDALTNPAATASNQNAGTSEATLPAGHPKIQLPAEALRFIQALQQKAEQNPNDLTLWNQFGDVAFRAALLDPAFYEAAARAYAHVLKLDPDNLGALRGLGNVNYDRRRYDEATAAYEHYLKEKPDDPAVRTDLGTLYLYTGNADQAVRQYNKALKVKPDFFEAYFNLGVAYNQMGQPGKATEALNHALALAPDDRARTQVRQLIAEANGSSPQAGAANPGLAMNPSVPATVAQSDAGTARPGVPLSSGATVANSHRPAASAPLTMAVVKVPNAASTSEAAANSELAASSGAAAGSQPGSVISASRAPASSALPPNASASTSLANATSVGNLLTRNDPASKSTETSSGTSGPSQGPTTPAEGGAAGPVARLGATGVAGQPPYATQTSASSRGPFASAIEAMVRGLPIAGARVKAVQWPSQDEAKVLLDNFPMDQMPPFAKEKFIADIKEGIEQAKKSYRVEQPFKLELADADSGRVMETITQ